MDALSFIHGDVREQAVTCDVLRKQGGGYSGEYEPVGTVDVAIFAPSSSNQVVVEGSDEDTSMTGMVVPDYDDDDQLVEHVNVNDVLSPQSHSEKRYDVRVKDGIPNELSPELWRLGLEHANQSN